MLTKLFKKNTNLTQMPIVPTINHDADQQLHGEFVSVKRSQPYDKYNVYFSEEGVLAKYDHGKKDGLEIIYGGPDIRNHPDHGHEVIEFFKKGVADPVVTKQAKHELWGLQAADTCKKLLLLDWRSRLEQKRDRAQLLHKKYNVSL